MLRILHTNDFHGMLDDARVERLRRLRDSADCYFDCGDCIKAGNLAIPLKPDSAWPRLASLQCTASVPGNRESHPLEGPFRSKLEGSSHPILCANLRRRDGSTPLPANLVIEASGLKLGVFGVMVPMVTERMASALASQFLWDDPIAIARKQVEELRPQVDCLIALTHIGFKKDIELARACPAIDLVLGGHSHTVLAEPHTEGATAICQAGSHGRFAGVYVWGHGLGLVDHRLEPLK